MDMDEVKKEISNLTGVPEELLNGETAEENLARAKALTAYKKMYGEAAQATQPKETRDIFADYFNDSLGIKNESEPPQPIQPAPTVKDGGEIRIPQQKSTTEALQDWINETLPQKYIF